MSARMQFPLSQRRHTNIAVVRYSKNGVKLEIACYKNKVISYRSGTENRLDEVLQVERIFVNVARGFLASEKEIQAVFGDEMTEQEAIKYMLDHGELQVAQQERTAEVDEMFKDIAVIISQKCVNTKTQHPFPPQVIEQALRSIGAAVKLDQPVKKQALGLIHLLIDSSVIPIARANMRIRCTTTSEAAVEKLRGWCRDNDTEMVETDMVSRIPSGNGDGGAGHSLLLLMQPNLFRDLDHFVKAELPVGSTIHMVEAAVTEIADSDALLDVDTVSRANAHPGLTEEAAAADVMRRTGTAPSSSSAGGANFSHSGCRGGGKKIGEDAENSSHGKPQSDCEGKRGRAGRARHATLPTRRGKESADHETNSLLDDATDATSQGGASAENDIATALQRLGLGPSRDFDSDSDDACGRGRGGKKKTNKRKSARGAGAEPRQGQVIGSTRVGSGAAASDDDDDGAGRRGKKNKNSKKGKKTAAVIEKVQPVVTETLSDSDEELMGNRKQRSKKQQEAHVQRVGDEWDEEDFDYGEDDEAGDQMS